jgi:hypothetical protein
MDTWGSTARQKVRLVTYAWGEQHVEELLNCALASALAPGNLPALTKVFDCTVVVVTENVFFDIVRSSEAGRAIESICRLKLVALDDLISESWQYGMTLTYSLFRGFEDLGSAMTETYILFLNSDFILANGSYERLIPHILSDERVHLSPSYCTVSERVEPILITKAVNGALSIPPREMATLILENCHNTILAKTVNQALMNFEHTDQFYWRADRNTLVGHQMPISLIGMRPERHLVSLNTFWDWGIVYEFCPSKRLTVIGDSDDFLMMELRPEKRSIESIRLGRSSPKNVAKRMKGYITQYQVDNARFPLFLHSSDLPADLTLAQQSLGQYVKTVLKNLPSTPIDHRSHAQWRYHQKHFRERLERSISGGFSRARKGMPTISNIKSDTAGE